LIKIIGYVTSQVLPFHNRCELLIVVDVHLYLRQPVVYLWFGCLWWRGMIGSEWESCSSQWSVRWIRNSCC